MDPRFYLFGIAADISENNNSINDVDENWTRDTIGYEPISVHENCFTLSYISLK